MSNPLDALNNIKTALFCVVAYKLAILLFSSIILGSPKAKVMRTMGYSYHPSPPLRVSGLTEEELEIILATDPDSRSTPATPDSRGTASPFSKIETPEALTKKEQEERV